MAAPIDSAKRQDMDNIMELKTLWLGLLISMAAFAVKTGLGWAYMWSKCRPRRKAVGATMAVIGLYALMFFGIWLLVSKVNLMSHYALLQPLWASGVTLHWLVAGLLFLWGLALLKSGTDDKAGLEKSSRGWLALVIPCPVCLSVVLMSAAGLALYFPDRSGPALAALFGAFTALAAISGLSLVLGRGRTAQPWEPTLGLAMMLMAAYFIVSALVMPQFADISKVYRLAAYGGESQAADPLSNWLTISSILGLLGLGFFMTRTRYRRARSQARVGQS